MVVDGSDCGLSNAYLLPIATNSRPLTSSRNIRDDTNMDSVLQTLNHRRFVVEFEFAQYNTLLALLRVGRFVILGVHMVLASTLNPMIRVDFDVLTGESRFEISTHHHLAEKGSLDPFG